LYHAFVGFARRCSAIFSLAAPLPVVVVGVVVTGLAAWSFSCIGYYLVFSRNSKFTSKELRISVFSFIYFYYCPSL
jgi:hypothetical protein